MQPLATSPNPPSSTAHSVKQRLEETVARGGKWTAHNIYLGDGIFTVGADKPADARIERFAKIISDLDPRPWQNLRILDLACLEGLFAIDFGRRGAKTVGIEVREIAVEKARFSKDVLKLDGVEIVQDDVRNLSRAKYGKFDVVLCCGVLYHLDFPDVLLFMEKLREVCDGFAIVDTHIALEDVKANGFKLTDLKSRTDRGVEYWGRFFREHQPNQSREDRLRASWASVDNEVSFWLTRRSLSEALAGFSSVFEHLEPELVANPDRDRITVVALQKGRDRAAGQM